MASASGETIGEILAKAVESYRRELLLEDTNEAFSKLKEQADLWKGELDEREEWEGSLLDGQSNHE
jgi:molybdopterin synthase catalytic subunit